MSHLGTKDLQAALRFALHAGEAGRLEGFRRELLPRLRALVACDTLGYNEIDLEQRTAVTFSDAPVFDGVERRLLALAHEHPLIACQRRGDLSARLISDFLSVREFHRLALYHDVYRLLGIEDQLAFGLPGNGIVAINLGRHKRTFSERDRELLELLRPHLAAAYTRIRETERARVLIEALDVGLEERGTGIVLLDARGRVEHVSGGARELLCAYFEQPACKHDEVPLRFRAWLEAPRQDASSCELMIDGARGRLCIRAHPACAGEKRRTISLHEHRASAPRLDALHSLGLTRRQAQVLRLLACGKHSRQIASELQISTATVSKHLEHIYARLGVSSRTQAIARVHSFATPAVG